MIRRSTITIFAVLLFFNNKTLAQEPEFDTTYNIEYSVNTSLEVEVKENIAIINQTASAAPLSFNESITNISIYDIKVYDAKDKEITPEIEEKDKSIIIKIPIQNPAIGKNKQTKLTLTYKTKDLVQKIGRILSVTVPKAPVSNLMQEYNAALKIPKDFGPQISVSPKPIREEMQEQGYVLYYNKQTLQDYGISATFGDYQILDFELGDKLTNTSYFSQTFKVALPPPIKNYQEIAMKEFEPTPTKLLKDKDGNVVAVYRVGGKKSLTLSIKGKAKVYNQKIDANISNDLSNLPSNLKVYLAPTDFWPTKAEAVVNLTHDMSTAKDVYDYLTKTIKYDYENADKPLPKTRKGVTKTLEEKKGLCLDFTDTFITLTRALGIPAREINGYAYTANQDTTPTALGEKKNLNLHSWAQYYHTQYGWVAVDPTWGATSGLDYFSKLDNNHLAFVIRGQNEQNLQPPNHISVDFSNDDYFDNTSLYDLDNLPTDVFASRAVVLSLVAFLTLALCMIGLGLKARSKGR